MIHLAHIIEVMSTLRRKNIVQRTKRFTTDYGLAQDVGAQVSKLPKHHGKRKAIAQMLKWYRREPGIKAGQRKGSYR